MKTFLVFVASLDGKITRWGDTFVRAWSSKEDQAYFSGLIKSASLVVMGSNTYNADPIKPRSDRLMVVLTSKPGDYMSLEVPGQLIFTNKSPVQLVEQYKIEGYKEMLVAGGPGIATSFFEKNLIDEVWLTIEPLIFGSGGTFTTDMKLNIKLTLLSCEKLNDAGTLLTKYAVIK
jgi:dihydrofolate reductase